jgi:hypothetical protein
MQNNALIINKSPYLLPAVRVVGAVLILFVGADHYYAYSVDQYSVLPTIGTLFLLNFISATAVGLLLFAPLDRISRRFGLAALRLLAASGFGIAATSLVALLVSEQTRLFGFMELNYRPAILVAIASEAAAAAFLALLFVLTVRGSSRSAGPRAGAGERRITQAQEEPRRNFRVGHTRSDQA